MKLVYFILIAVVVQCNLVPSSNVTTPTVVHLTHKLSTVLVDTTLQAVMPTPSSITSVVDIQIKEGGEKCKLVELQPLMIGGSFISIDGKTIEISIKKWDAQIMSFTYSFQTNLLYTLLDNGTITLSPFVLNNFLPLRMQVQRSYVYESLGAVDTWFTIKHKIFELRGQLYVLQSEQFTKIMLHSQGYWTKDINVIKNAVVKVQKIGDVLFILTSKQLIQLDGQDTRIVINQKGLKFIDFCVIGPTVYLLDSQQGLISVSIQKAFDDKIYDIPSPDNMIKLRGVDSTLFIIYQIDNRNYMAEYFIEGDNIILNRYYHNYYQIKDIHPTNNYAIVDGYNEFFILHHSINRMSFPSLTPIQQVYKSYGLKVVDIQLLPSTHNLTFLLAMKDKIQQLTFPSHQNSSSSEYYGVNSQFLKCSSNQNTIFTVKAVFKGVCSSHHHSAQKYACSVESTNLVSFDYNHNKRLNTAKQHRFFFIIIYLTLIIFLILYIIIIRKRFQEKQAALKKKLQIQRAHQQQHSVNMQKSFNQNVAAEAK